MLTCMHMALLNVGIVEDQKQGENDFSFNP